MSIITLVDKSTNPIDHTYYINLKLSNTVKSTYASKNLDTLYLYDYAINLSELNPTDYKTLSKYVILNTEIPVFNYLKPLYPELFL
jgi:hypothetical protein